MRSENPGSTRFSPHDLADYCQKVLSHYGVEEEQASLAAQLLLTSDLRGIDSHGVARLWVYAKWLDGGYAKPRPNIRITRETPSTVAFHGDNGLGIVVGPYVNRKVIEKAEAVGSAWGTVSHSNHFGIAGYYSLQAVAHDMIGMVFSNATAQMYPVGSFHPMLGTNPISVAFPAGEERPIVIDMATSTVAFGKIEIARREHRALPEGWAVLRDGSPITDPEVVYREPHSMSPIGSIPTHANHKGYCFAAIADLLGGVLSGASWGPHCPHFFFPEKPFSEQTANGLGQCFSAMRIDGFVDTSEYKQRVDQWIRAFRNTPPADPSIPVMVPGDPEWRTEDDRKENGIPLNVEVIKSLTELSRTTGVSFPQ